MTNSTGCTAFWESEHFPLIVSPDNTLNHEELAYIALATQRWNTAVGREVFVVKPGYLQMDGGDYQAGITLTSRGLPKPLLGYCPVIYKEDASGRLGSIMRGVCIINSAPIRDNPTKYITVVTHELGHALGFPHNKHDNNDIMFPTVGNNSGGREVSPKHLDAVTQMLDDEYKLHSVSGLPSCF